MPVEAFVKFSVEYSIGKSIELKVFRIERRNFDPTSQMGDIIQKVISYASLNFNTISVEEITNYIINEFDDVVAIEITYPNNVGFTVYINHDN